MRADDLTLDFTGTGDQNTGDAGYKGTGVLYYWSSPKLLNHLPQDNTLYQTGNPKYAIFGTFIVNKLIVNGNSSALPASVRLTILGRPPMPSPCLRTIAGLAL